jgi:hypothetical protein
MVEPAVAEAGEMGGRAPSRPRRRLALIIVGAVLAIGLAYEFIRFDHSLAGRLEEWVVGGILVIGIVVVLLDPGRSRIGRAVAGCALAAALVFTVAQLRTSPDPLVGGWTATATGMSALPVAITVSPAGYTVRSTAVTRLPGSTCDLPPGTVLAAFTAAGSGSAPTAGSNPQGQQLASPSSNCQAGWEAATFSLADDGTTLHTKVPSGHDLVLVKQG